MMIYIAGAITGNLNPIIKNVCTGKNWYDSINIYLAGQNGREKIVKEFIKMNLYLAGHGGMTKEEEIKYKKKLKPRILESFYYINNETKKMIPYYKDFLLDSGAFTFMQNTKVKINWDEYVEKYAKFIKENDIKHFFELDIDNIVGLKEVERLRKKLETLSERKCIPVWHKSRGLEYYKKMCKEYDYIAIGGIVTKEIKATEYDMFIPLLKIAKQNNCKVHGLGFTRISLLKKYHFYSVDSTAWTTGNRFGHIYRFKDGKLLKIDKPKGKRVKTNICAINNFTEWVKFCEWAEKYL